MFDIGAPELLVILVAALVLFGPKKLPELGRGLGESIRAFRRSVQGLHDDPALDQGGGATPDRAPDQGRDRRA